MSEDALEVLRRAMLLSDQRKLVKVAAAEIVRGRARGVETRYVAY